VPVTSEQGELPQTVITHHARNISEIDTESRLEGGVDRQKLKSTTLNTL
jgi:hypothetical protein